MLAGLGCQRSCCSLLMDPHFLTSDGLLGRHHTSVIFFTEFRRGFLTNLHTAAALLPFVVSASLRQETEISGKGESKNPGDVNDSKPPKLTKHIVYKQASVIIRCKSNNRTARLNAYCICVIAYINIADAHINKKLFTCMFIEL